MQKILSILFLLVLICGSLFIGIVPLGGAQSGRTVSGIISSDTTWTKANSPYNLSGNIGVLTGVTFTIEPGVVVNLNGYYIQINGTLIARGTSTNQIQFNGGSLQGITVNSQVGSISSIAFATIDSALSVNSTIVDHCVITRGFFASGSNVTHNTITSGVSVSDSTSLVSNVISGIINGFAGSHVPIVTATTQTNFTTPVIVENNTIIGGSLSYSGQAYTGISCFGFVSITNNFITNCQEAIYVVSFSTTENVQIQKNSLYYNGVGIFIKAGNSQATTSDNLLIKDNLIVNNSVGINVQKSDGIAKLTVINNNIYDNPTNFNWGLPSDIDIPNNYWGTTNETAISQSIRDSKSDFNLGTVNFYPFLSKPNQDAPEVIPTSVSSSSSAIPEFSLTYILTILLATASLLIICTKNHRRQD